MGLVDRDQKFRQAAMYYLLVGVVYEAAVFIAWRQGFAPPGRGPVWLWLITGAIVLGLIVWGLWSWRNVWLPRVLWVLNAVRLPFLLGSAYVPAVERQFAPEYYQLQSVLVLINLWMLARAGWDV